MPAATNVSLKEVTVTVYCLFEAALPPHLIKKTLICIHKCVVYPWGVVIQQLFIKNKPHTENTPEKNNFHTFVSWCELTRTFFSFMSLCKRP